MAKGGGKTAGDGRPAGDSREELGAREIAIEWVEDASVPVTFVNTILSQFTHGEFILTFAQYIPPDTRSLGPEELDRIRSVPARVVLRVGLSPARMRELI